MIRKAVSASLEANFVTEDIDKGQAKKTSEVGDWLANYIKKA
jgi:3-isopropylmalate dehydrogenase